MAIGVVFFLADNNTARHSDEWTFRWFILFSCKHNDRRSDVRYESETASVRMFVHAKSCQEEVWHRRKSIDVGETYRDVWVDLFSCINSTISHLPLRSLIDPEAQPLNLWIEMHRFCQQKCAFYINIHWGMHVDRVGYRWIRIKSSLQLLVLLPLPLMSSTSVKMKQQHTVLIECQFRESATTKTNPWSIHM